jgi:hypothetical protein
VLPKRAACDCIRVIAASWYSYLGTGCAYSFFGDADVGTLQNQF